MYTKAQNEYFGKSKAFLLYDKLFCLSMWKTRWKVWKTQRIFKAFEPVLWKIRKAIDLYMWKTQILIIFYRNKFLMNIQ